MKHDRRHHTGQRIMDAVGAAASELKRAPKTRRALEILGNAVAAQGAHTPSSWLDDFQRIMDPGRKGGLH